ncbi:MAG: hypothetical protein VW642_03390, partial [Halieaceae bacterium]
MTAHAADGTTTAATPSESEETPPDGVHSTHDSVTQTTAPTTDTALSEATVDPAAADSEEEGWIDGGHGYAARKANEMTQWVDNFFGNDERDLEQAESRLRLRTIYDWDQRLSNEVKFRLGGKVNLPQISDRLDLVFRGEE